MQNPLVVKHCFEKGYMLLREWLAEGECLIIGEMGLNPRVARFPGYEFNTEE